MNAVRPLNRYIGLSEEELAGVATIATIGRIEIPKSSKAMYCGQRLRCPFDLRRELVQ
jgi:hypothetical protein